MKGQVIAEISVIPLGTASPALSHYIADCLKVLKDAPDISYQLTAMGTIIEGPLERVLWLAQKMHQAPFEMGAQRVITSIKIDERRDKSQTMKDKVESVVSRREE